MDSGGDRADTAGPDAQEVTGRRVRLADVAARLDAVITNRAYASHFIHVSFAAVISGPMTSETRSPLKSASASAMIWHTGSTPAPTAAET